MSIIGGSSRIDGLPAITRRYMSALSRLQLDGVNYEYFRLPQTWRLVFEAGGDALLLRSQCRTIWVKHGSDDGPLCVEPHDVLLILDRGCVIAASDPLQLADASAPAAAERIKRTVSDSQQSADLVVGHSRRDSGLVVAAAPPVVHVPYARRAEYPRLFAIADLLSITPAHIDPQADQAVQRRLSEALAIETAAFMLESVSEPQSWMAGFADRHIANALALLHTDMQTVWTIASLASAVGLSRSVFAQRFHALVGMPPNCYFRQVRLHQAMWLLQDRRLSLGRISLMIGYQSEAAFNKAFLREFGITPGRYRTQTRGQPSPPVQQDRADRREHGHLRPSREKIAPAQWQEA